MKSITSLIVLFGWSVALPAQTPSSGPRLTGVVNLPGNKCALLSFADTRLYWPPQELILQEGERHTGVELLRILPESGAVEIRVDSSGQPTDTDSSATNLLLTLPAQTNALATRTPTVWLNGVSLRIALDLYSEFANRTLLRHPALRDSTVSLHSAATNAPEAATALAQSLASNNVAIILEGEKFALAVPKAYLGRGYPRVAAIKPSASLSGGPEPSFNARSVRFIGADLGMVTRNYSALLGRKVVETDWFRSASRAAIFFVNQTPLSRTEMLYAFETLFALNGVQFESEGDHLIKPVPYRAP